MADVMPRHHRGDGGDEPYRYPPTIPIGCEFAPPPKRRQHLKSLMVFQLYNKLGGPIPIQFDLERGNILCCWPYFEHYVRHIGSFIRQHIPPCY